MSTARSEVVVIGGGITGLVAAFELTGGASGPTATTPLVTVLEASGALGGKIAGIAFDGRVLDAGPDGALARRAEVAELVGELGLAEMIRPIAASGATIFARRRLRALPDDLAMGIPTRWSSLRRSGVLSRRGLLRALRDVVLPVPASRGHLQDRAIGSLVGTKLGDEVVTTLVDPMIGGINAGRVAEMSAAAIYPPLLEAAQRRGSLMKAMRASLPPRPEERSEAPPAFISLVGGMHQLVEQLLAELAARGVMLRCGAQVTSLVRLGGTTAGWSVNTSATATLADAVVLCAPAPAAAALLAGHDDEAAALLNQIDYASVAIATLEFADQDISLPDHGTGVLIPPGSPIPSGELAGQRFMATALTFLDRKWPHLKSDGTTVLRVHCGRIDDLRIASIEDDALIELLVGELGQLVELGGAPLTGVLKRWDDALPQYRVNHLMRVAGIEAAVARLEGLEIAGAAYHGVGVPACIASGRQAAVAVLEGLGDAPR
jgi:oxygen-dependent protoporphyrinogen oxidase